MDAIREAIQRRASGGPGTPAVQQMSAPQGQLPTGGANVPVPSQAPPVPQNVQQNVTPQSSPVSQEGSVVAKAKAGLDLDPESKNIAKALINKLMQIM